LNYCCIPKISLKVSCIGLGTWVLGGEMWGGAQEKDSIDAILSAIDLGVNFIDTAPVYGFGKAEEIIGKAIKHKRSKLIIATKCGLEIKEKRISHNLTPKFIREEIGNSLRRLQTDYIDIYQIHWPDANVSLEDSLNALNDLKRQGKIRHIGVSNFDKKLLVEALKHADIVTLQNQYSILERDIEKDILPFCVEKNIGLLAYGPLAGGILSGKYQKNPHFPKSDARNFFYPFYTKEAFPQVKIFLDELSKIKKPLNEIALNWVRQKKGVVSVLVGCRNADQVRRNIEALSWDLNVEEFEIIENALSRFFHA